MTTVKDENFQRSYRKSVTSFEGFLHQLRTARESYQDIQCDGFAHFLNYDLGNLNKLAKGREVLKPETNIQSTKNTSIEETRTDASDQPKTQTTTHTNNSKVSNTDSGEDEDKSPINGQPKETSSDESTTNDDTRSKKGLSMASIGGQLPIPTYVPTREDYMKVINQVRIEIRKKIIFPISKASGYKWEYSKGHFKDEILLLEFHCFQDISKDMQPSKFANSNLIDIYEIGQCSSSVNVFINIITRQIRITYRHKAHTRLIDIIYSLLSQIYNE